LRRYFLKERTYATSAYIGIGQPAFAPHRLALAVFDDVRRFGVAEALFFGVIFLSLCFGLRMTHQVKPNHIQ